MNRRSDHALRQTISNIEALMLAPAPYELVLTRSLEELMGLLGAGYGYVFSVPGYGEEFWHLHACYSGKEEPNTVSGISTSSKIPTELRPGLRSGRCMLGEGAPPGPHPLPAGHPDIDNYLCIPLRDANRLYAVLYLCNSQTGFNAELPERLRPLVAAICCLLRLGSNEKKKAEQDRVSEMSMDLLSILDAMFNGVVLLDEFDRIVLCNKAAAALFGLSRRDLVGENLSRFLRKGSENRYLSAEMDGEGKSSVWRGVPVRSADGGKRLVDVTSVKLTLAGKTRTGLVMEDISERMKSAAAYQNAMQRFHALTALAPVGMLQLNRNWECHYVNDTWCDYVKLTPEEVTGVGWLNSIYHADVDSFLDDMRRETQGAGNYSAELRFQTPLGQVTWAKVNACALYSESGELDGLIVTLNDITDHLRTEQKLREAAEVDQLTGLTNRSYFNGRLDAALESAERYGLVALMFIDLDNFKHINDTFGHDAGDSLLTQVAERLRECLRKVDTISRIGGDEFTVIITHLSNAGAVKMVAEKLVKALGEPFSLNGRTVYVTCSIGISVYSQDMNKEKLLKQADIALYKAKDSGRNQFRFFTSELNKDAGLLVSLRESIKERISEDFRLVYQPQIDAESGRIVGVEALARWTHPEAGAVGPDIFIKLIEQSGLMGEFSVWLFAEAFRQASEWRQYLQNGMQVSINLSAKQFRGIDLVYSVGKLCTDYDVNPRHIVLEVTETALIQDTDLATETLSRLHNLGFSISLDDFGTGYSSLLYLRQMPLDSVKIDRSFTKDVIVDDEDAKIVSGILSLAEALDLKVVAEGVETEEVRSWLQAHGCNLHQGYYYHRPLEVPDITSLLQKI